MTEFKQILGRGTRVHEDTHKYYFTLMDFRGATHHFADPDFDGEPVQIYDPDDDDPIVPPETERGSRRGRDRRRCRERHHHRYRTSLTVAQDLRQRSARHDHRRAGQVPRRRRQAHHREPAGLLEEGGDEPVRVARHLPAAVEAATTGSKRSSRSWRSEGLRLEPSPTRSTRTSTRSTSSATLPMGGRR